MLKVGVGNESGIGEEQCRFWQGTGCLDQVFTARKVCEKYLVHGKDVFSAYLDLEKPYDTIKGHCMWQRLRMYDVEVGVSGKLLKALQSFYVDSRGCVQLGKDVSEWFPVNIGLRHGCVMSPWFFNIYMNCVMPEDNARVLRKGLKLLCKWWQV